MSTIEVATAQFSDVRWRLNNLYQITDKDGKAVPFRTNWAQQRFVEDMHYLNLILKARQLGFCLDPKMRVLTADLKWVPISELQPGREIVSVDEHAPGGRGQARKMRTAVVQACVEVRRKAYRVTFDDGRSVVCTGQHPWLSRKVATDSDWRSIEAPTKKKLIVGTKVRWITKPWDEPAYEDGWFGGMLDGEGSIAKTNTSASVSVSQKPGAVWKRLVEYCRSRGYSYRFEDDGAIRKTKYGKTPVPKLVVGRMDELFRLVGQTRPVRFLGNRFWEGRELPGKKSSVGWAAITKIEPIGEQTMVDLQTSTGTYIAEGFVSHNTTFIQLFMLDACLFNSNVRCGVIAQTQDDAKVIFRDKVKFPYDHLPDQLRTALPFRSDSASELLLSNNSGIRVGTSMRSGTLQYLHVSEYGKICAKSPEKAREVRTGALNTVQAGQFAFIESTAEGQEGHFFELCQEAQELQRRGRTLTDLDFKFHFFPWWQEPAYAMNAEHVEISAPLQKYFEDLAKLHSIELGERQRAWYAMKHKTQGADMKREYPSTPSEAFEAAVEGAYYGDLMAQADEEKRITRVPHDPSFPVHTMWDLGLDDCTAIWFLQRVGLAWHFIDFYQNSGHGLSHYAKELDRRPYKYGDCILPHDGGHRNGGRDDQETGKPMTARDILESLGVRRTRIMARRDKTVSINGVRQMLPKAYFDAEKCAEGLKAMRSYRRDWDEARGTWMDNPRHDWASHPCDSIAEGAAADPQNDDPFAKKLVYSSRGIR